MVLIHCLGIGTEGHTGLRGAMYARAHPQFYSLKPRFGNFPATVPMFTVFTFLFVSESAARIFELFTKRTIRLVRLLFLKLSGSFAPVLCSVVWNEPRSPSLTPLPSRSATITSSWSADKTALISWIVTVHLWLMFSATWSGLRNDCCLL